MKSTPGGILLEFDDFPPSPEVLALLIKRAGEVSNGKVLIHAGRQFCWGFDDALRDCNAYPEEVFLGIMALGEKRGYSFLPVITPSDIDTFISAHSSTAAAFSRGDTSALLKILQRIIEGLVEDLLSVFRDARSALFLSDAGGSSTGKLILDHPEVLREAGISTDTQIQLIERKDMQQFVPGEAANDGVVIPVFSDTAGFSLPSPPGWLSLLDESFNFQVASFLEVYRKMDNILSSLWAGLRAAWEGRENRTDEQLKLISRLSELLGQLDSAAAPLFSRDWFKSRRGQWIRGYTRAFMYQRVEDDKFGTELSVLLSLLDPGSGQGPGAARKEAEQVFTPRGNR